MSLVAMSEMLQQAKGGKYAVGSFNVFNFETLCAVVEAAEETKSPVILSVPERLFRFVDMDTLSAAMVNRAQRSSVPVALHMDHAHSYDGILRAVRWGFTSVMFDGSKLPFEENLKRTKEICSMAHALGISVEGELGYRSKEEMVDVAQLATVDMAAEFVAKTHVDALAIAFRNREGGQINTDKLEELAQAVNIPLVMHSGGKLPSYKEVIAHGISKVNVPTDMSTTAIATLKAECGHDPSPNYINLMAAVKKAVKGSAKEYMIKFDCVAKA